MRALLLLAAFVSGLGQAIAASPSAAELAAQGNYGDALRILRGELKAAEAANDAAASGEALLALGELFLSVGDTDKARTQFEQGLRMAEKAGSPVAKGRTLVGLARLDMQFARYASANARLTAALPLVDASGNHSARILVRRLLAELLQRQGSQGEAERRLDEADQLVAAAKDPAQRSGMLAQRGDFDFRRGAYKRALSYWTEARIGFHELGHAVAEAQAVLRLGEIALALGLIDDAKSHFELSLTRFRELADPAREASADLGLGQVYLRQNRPDRALVHAERALDSARRRHDYLTEADALVQQGEVWLSDPVPSMAALPLPEHAIKRFKEALQVYRQAGDRYGENRTGLKVGLAYLDGAMPRLAARVLEVVSREAELAGDAETLWRALYGEARAQEALGNPDEGLRRYARAMDALETVYGRTAGLDQSTRSSFLAERRRLYEDYVGLLIRYGKGAAAQDVLAKAFGIAELARSRQFTEMLDRSGIEQAAARESPALRELVQRERTLRQDLDAVTKALATSDADSLLLGRRRNLDTDLAQVQATIAKGFPRYAELAAPGHTDVRNVQAVLAKDEVLLSYFSLRGKLLAFVVAAKNLQLVEIPLRREELRQMIERFRRPLSELQNLSQLDSWRPQVAFDLYDKVFAPVERWLPEHARIFVAADDALYTLPFEAFLRALPPGRPLWGDSSVSQRRAFDWLGDRRSLAYVPSASALKALRSRPATGNWSRSMVAFADPDFGDERSPSASAGMRGSVTGQLISRATGVTGIPRLPETADEAKAIASTIGGKPLLFLREQASEDNLSRLDLKGTRYLLFSTHGLLGGDFAAVGEPALVLSLVGNPEGTDGFLTMSEVLGLRLDADLTVLSACNTAGEPQEARGGDGFAGLTRSFAYAGSRSLIVSHWPVASEATVRLMTRFFGELGKGRSKREALAAARKMLRGQTVDGIDMSHPYFWAPFVLVGDSQ